MSTSARTGNATIIPGLRYQDGAAAVEWLCTAFGFEQGLVVPGENGNVAHAQLLYGNGMIMLGGGPHGGGYDQYVQPPPEPDKVNTQAAYIIVPDVDAHCARAAAAGAEIIMEPYDPEYGGRAYACRDPEGHIWNFGTHDPWTNY